NSMSSIVRVYWLCCLDLKDRIELNRIIVNYARNKPELSKPRQRRRGCRDGCRSTEGVHELTIVEWGDPPGDAITHYVVGGIWDYGLPCNDIKTNFKLGYAFYAIVTRKRPICASVLSLRIT